MADRLPALEVQVMNSDFQRPEELLEQLFLLRHELLVSRTMAAQCHDIYARLASTDRHTTDAARTHAHDLREQFERTRSVADEESQFLFGVIGSTRPCHDQDDHGHGAARGDRGDHPPITAIPQSTG